MHNSGPGKISVESPVLHHSKFALSSKCPSFPDWTKAGDLPGKVSRFTDCKRRLICLYASKLHNDALTTFSIIVGLTGGLLSDAYSYMKIMLSSVVVEHCLLGIECWRKFTIGWVYYWRWIIANYSALRPD